MGSTRINSPVSKPICAKPTRNFSAHKPTRNALTAMRTCSSSGARLSVLRAASILTGKFRRRKHGLHSLRFSEMGFNAVLLRHVAEEMKSSLS